jgi:hypothetical protein
LFKYEPACVHAIEGLATSNSTPTGWDLAILAIGIQVMTQGILSGSQVSVEAGIFRFVLVQLSYAALYVRGDAHV